MQQLRFTMHFSTILFTVLFSLAAAKEHSDCDVVVIGAGIGGAYSAWRLAVDSAAHPGPKICLFEAKNRPGGRILSVENPVPGFENFTVDLGAYRYVFGSSSRTPSFPYSYSNVQFSCPTFFF